MSQCTIEDLLDHPGLIPVVIAWIQGQWPKEWQSLESVKARLLGSHNPNQLPLALIALDAKATPVGYVSLIQLTLKEAKGQQYWVDGLYVEVTQRGHGLGSKLLQAATSRAKNLGLDHLSAYTTSISLYARNGWSVLPGQDESASGPIIMRKSL